MKKYLPYYAFAFTIGAIVFTAITFLHPIGLTLRGLFHYIDFL